MSAPDLLFYDGGCGLCHRAVSFAVRRDPQGRAFRFAPLQGETFLARVPEAQRRGLPDSLVVLTEQGRLHTRSSATVYLLRRLGGGWPLVGGLLWLVPRPLRNLGYDLVARVRARLFQAPDGVCPILPRELRERFLP